MNYQFENESVSLIVSLPKEKCDSFECSFVAKSNNTGKMFALTIKSEDLPKVNLIFAIDRLMIFDLIKHEPNVLSVIMQDNSEDHILVEYVCHVFGKELSLKFQIYPLKDEECKEGEKDEVYDLKEINQYLKQGIIEMKKMNQIFMDQITELKKEVADLQGQIIVDDMNKLGKSVIIVPFDKIVSTNDQAYDFLTYFYCPPGKDRDEFKKFVSDRPKIAKDILVNEFLNSSSKILFYNMHYINRVEKRQFVSVFEYCENYGIENDKTSAVSSRGLGFITIHTDKIFRYQKYDKTMDMNFDGLFVFHWFQPVQHYELFTECKNGMVLRIVQCY